MVALINHLLTYLLSLLHIAGVYLCGTLWNILQMLSECHRSGYLLGYLVDKSSSPDGTTRISLLQKDGVRTYREL